MKPMGMIANENRVSFTSLIYRQFKIATKNN